MARDIDTVGVVGLGTMGAGIAEVLARNGLAVIAVEADEAALAHGSGIVASSTRRAVERGKLTAEEQAALLDRIDFTTSLERLAGVDLVIEAVPERLDLKREIFGKLDTICSPDAVLATNTSSLSVTEISVSTHNPRRVVGMHFFNPAPVQRFVEVIRTVVSEQPVVDSVVALAQRLGKQPVVVGDKAGFIANALLFGYLNHAVSLFEQRYASREDIDAAMVLGCGLPMGPLALMDLIGLDTAYEILDTMYRQGRDRLHAPSPVLKQMVTAGLRGRKSGRGFYTYAEPGSSKVVPDEQTPADGAAEAGAPRVRTVGVVGSGTMATGIVEVFAKAGFEVVYVARAQDKVAAVRAAMSRSLEKAVQRGKLDEAGRDAALGRIRGTTVLEDLSAVDLVVEAVVEDLAVKQALFENLDEICAPDAILATTTSSLPVIECAASTRRPRAVVGMHFFNPAPVMRLVEVVHTVSTAPRGGGRCGRGLPGARQAPGELRRPGGVHRERAAVPLPQRLGADARRALRERRRHRHRDEGRVRLPDGPVRAARRGGAGRGPGDPAHAVPGVPRARVRPHPAAGAPGHRGVPGAQGGPRVPHLRLRLRRAAGGRLSRPSSTRRRRNSHRHRRWRGPGPAGSSRRTGPSRRPWAATGRCRRGRGGTAPGRRRGPSGGRPRRSCRRSGSGRRTWAPWPPWVGSCRHHARVPAVDPLRPAARHGRHPAGEWAGAGRQTGGVPRSNHPRRRGRPVRSGPAGADADADLAAAAADADRLRGGFRRVEHDRTGSWVVTGVSGASALKTYRCPGCDQEIRPGTPHVVVWAAERPLASAGELADRRHWHSPCWAARSRRTPR